MPADRTIRLHRVLPTKPEKVYKAFIDADAKARWLPPNGFTCKVHRWDPKVGGAYRMSFTNFTTGNIHTWTGRFLELRPGELVKYADTFEDPNLPGEVIVTVRLKQVTVGTDMRIEQANVPEAIPLEACYLGWQESLECLAKLVTPEISD